VPSLQARSTEEPESSTQMIVVTTAGWDAVEGRLQRYERATPRGKWKAAGPSAIVVVGKSGLGWGIGILPFGSRQIRGPADPVKKEGDGRAPAGVFRLRTIFGYSPQPPPAWKMPYMGLTPSVECVDDPSSKSYNRVLDRAAFSPGLPDWHSSEHMLRSDELYRWGVIVDHNAPTAAPGGGSCIFLHIWRGRGMGTVGCTAMPQEQLETVLAWLDPARKPLLVQLPVLQYKKLRKPWKLPPL
jgi:L,D-transpeptidase catalytic domain